MNDYCAVLSENNWYRACVKKNPLNHDELILFYIDYGYEEKALGTSIKILDQQFYEEPRYAFGINLIDREFTENNQKIIELGDKNNELILDATFEEFFVTGLDEFQLKIISKLDKKADHFHLEDEVYYGVQMFNKNELCLNDMISSIKEEQVLIDFFLFISRNIL